MVVWLEVKVCWEQVQQLLPLDPWQTNQCNTAFLVAFLCLAWALGLLGREGCLLKRAEQGKGDQKRRGNPLGM
jgi:hypothetical protein